MKAAGTAAQRCGWSVQRAEHAASRAQPRANAGIAEPGMAGSAGPGKAATARPAAAGRPGPRQAAPRGPPRRLRAGATAAWRRMGAAALEVFFDVIISGSSQKGFWVRAHARTPPNEPK